MSDSCEANSEDLMKEIVPSQSNKFKCLEGQAGQEGKKAKSGSARR